MRVSARNVLKGRVKEVTEGMVNSEIIIELPGGQQIVSIITKHSAKSLGWRSARMSMRSSRRLPSWSGR